MKQNNATTKALWTAPKLKEMGDIGKVTLSINMLGGGDKQFSILNS